MPPLFCIASPEFIELFSRVKLICKDVRIKTKLKKKKQTQTFGLEFWSDKQTNLECICM